ncbi:glycine cleavage system aminomethyltransferase GcvT [Atribacter laminatus]|uniref:Aminomethyltransferase n=1 Tax=Atribacter laminatus TaxID=2847778 RepID=A0A7T1AL44_ATRLM|nr:glycine cleavage system aminomethyltransferase GcvT [Atribacter laminatus]QPM67941.1 Aminomethyltransferase [Atribacter laminatus]
MTKHTPLYNNHLALGAKMVPFAGWEMPLFYKTITYEHEAVRTKAGIFDLTHMGELRIFGKNCELELAQLTTNDPARLLPGRIQYSLLCRPNGGIIDDILAYRLEDEFFLVVNAANTTKDYEWIKSHLKGTAQVENLTDSKALIAIQGPESEKIVAKLEPAVLKLKYYSFLETNAFGPGTIISRTGYTGEDGFELYIPWEQAIKTWNSLEETARVKQVKLIPIGLGARDTLRLEMRYPLYGNDIDDETTPLEANLEWVVKFNHQFIGKESLLEQKRTGIKKCLVGFIVIDRGIPRQGYPIVYHEESVGMVTSGTFSPSLKKNIGMGYVSPSLAKPGTIVELLIREKKVRAEIIEGPFVSPKIKK